MVLKKVTDGQNQRVIFGASAAQIRLSGAMLPSGVEYWSLHSLFMSQEINWVVHLIEKWHFGSEVFPVCMY